MAAPRMGIVPLPVAFAHAEATASLPPLHRDPFDRLLVAQARDEGLTLVTHDPLDPGLSRRRFLPAVRMAGRRAVPGFTMTLVERITQDLTAAMKAQDAARTSTLRMAKAALMNKEIDKTAPLDDAEAVRVLQGLVKQREDSVEQYAKAGRPELAEKERAEIAVLKAYLPAEVTDEEIAAAVEKAVAETGAASPKDMGKVMKAALAALAAGGKPADGKRVNEAVRKRTRG